MALPFIPSDAGLLALQAGVVAAPRAVPRLERTARLHGRGWALVPIGSIVVVVFAIRYLSDTATALTYLALIAVPPLAKRAGGPPPPFWGEFDPRTRVAVGHHGFSVSVAGDQRHWEECIGVA